jgi:putative DNA primase/helicase
MLDLNGAAPITGEEIIFPELTDEDFDSEIARLSKLNAKKYERERVEAAKKLGVRTSVLDKLIKDSRPGGAAHGRALKLSDPEPSAEPVDAAMLLDAIAGMLKRFVICDDDARTAIALWITCTWFEESAQIAPILNLQSPMARCGKTTLLSLIAKLVKRALPSSNISAAAIYRVIEECTPTLIVDEADAFLNDNEEARGIINSGHTRDAAFVIRIEGDDRTPMMFSPAGGHNRRQKRYCKPQKER